MLVLESQQKLEQLILDQGLMTQAALEEAKLQAAQKNQSLVSILAENHLISEEELVKLEAEVSGVPYAKLQTINVSPEILQVISKADASNYMAVPFGMVQGRLAVAMIDPTNIQAVDFLARKAGRSLVTYMATRDSIDHVLAQYPAALNADVNAALGKVDLDVSDEQKEQQHPTASNVQNLVQDAPITRVLNTILDYAVQSRASDIHIEPRQQELKVRFRIDGILQDTMTLPKSIEPALISRIKILSNLKIDEHRVPQDGQFQIRSGSRETDLRIAIAPITNGEQVVIRLLNKDNDLLTLDALGFRGRTLRRITEGIHKPHGMTLATGPTGSGKSTTLYAVISAIKDVSINIVTLEDPVEYKMDGINQMQVNADVGLTFASGLRSILRQDPNVVMVGEIRDKETADLAVQAALTGHVVLSTLHTNSASGVLPRLLDMSIEPFLISSTVNTVIGQRLVRRLCDNCRNQTASTALETKSIQDSLGAVLPESAAKVKEVGDDLGYDNLPLTGQKAYTLFRAVGCNKCVRGYKGRMGIHEVFTMSDAMERLLAERATTTQIQNQAQKDGMLTMKQDGYLKALEGITTLEEVARVAADY